MKFSNGCLIALGVVFASVVIVGVILNLWMLSEVRTALVELRPLMATAAVPTVVTFAAAPSIPTVAPTTTTEPTPVPTATEALVTVVEEVPNTPLPPTPTAIALQPIPPTLTFELLPIALAKSSPANAPSQLYSGPGIQFAIIGTVVVGQMLSIGAVSPAGDWYMLADGGWVSAYVVDSQVEAVASVATPMPLVALATVPTEPPTSMPSPTPDLSEIVTSGEWSRASYERKQVNVAVWTQRLVQENMIGVDPSAFAVELLACVDTTILGSIQTLGEGYAVLDIAAACAVTLSTVPVTATQLPVLEVPTATSVVGQLAGQPFVCTNGCATAPDPSCNIKGNVNSEGERIYHTIDSQYYERTDIKPEEGDVWFCTVAEAEASGFRAPLN